MSSLAAKSLARRHAAVMSRQIKRKTKAVELAIVTGIAPLALTLVDGGLELAEDILILGSGFRKYDRDFGVVAGDVVALVELASKDYYVLDVQTENEVMKGLGTVAEAGTTKPLAVTGTADLGTGVVTGSVSLVVAHWLEAYDAAGNSIGFVPVLAAKT